MENSEKTALTFLTDRGRKVLDVTNETYMAMLMEFGETHGEFALRKLAGFFLFAIRLPEGQSTKALHQVFNHDLYGRNDKFMLPRSDNYLEYWNNEFHFK